MSRASKYDFDEDATVSKGPQATLYLSTCDRRAVLDDSSALLATQVKRSTIGSRFQSLSFLSFLQADFCFSSRGAHTKTTKRTKRRQSLVSEMKISATQISYDQHRSLVFARDSAPLVYV